jgi:hypothetical protein
MKGLLLCAGLGLLALREGIPLAVPASLLRRRDHSVAANRVAGSATGRHAEARTGVAGAVGRMAAYTVQPAWKPRENA